MFTKEIILYILIFFSIFELAVDLILTYLNNKRWSEKLPDEVKDIYNEDEYKKSMKYQKTLSITSKYSNIFITLVILVFLYFGFFGKIYDFILTFGFGDFISNLIFAFVLVLGSNILAIPFSYYLTFKVEEKFGFNKMTKKIFFSDLVKGFLVSTVVGGLILSAIMGIYSLIPNYFWLLGWGFMMIFSFFSIMLYSVVIVPLFNKQTPLQDGSLKEKINEFAKKMGFKLDKIFVIDGSKRSTKANAYFSGFGPKKRIVLYDTLIKDLTEEELVAVLAHEIGHYKKKHIIWNFIFSGIQSLIIFYILGLVLGNDLFSLAMGSENNSFVLSMLAFFTLFTPISMILGIFANIMSRKFEYQADEFCAQNNSAKELSNALIKLSKNNLSNLTPHPAYEFFYYSHPTVLKRLKALESKK